MSHESVRYDVWVNLYKMTELNHSWFDFKQFCKNHPLIDGYTRTGRAVDKNNMVLYIKKLKGC